MRFFHSAYYTRSLHYEKNNQIAFINHIFRACAYNHAKMIKTVPLNADSENLMKWIPSRGQSGEA